MNTPQVDLAALSRQRAGLLALVSMAGLYFLAGTAGLLLTVPGGFASPLFPAAGIALALALHRGGQAVIAVWLGTLAMNVYGGYRHDEAGLASLLQSGAMLACGNAAQAWIGAAIVRAWTGDGWRRLERELDALRLLGGGGVIACFTSATGGVSSLVLLGQLPGERFLFEWWNWYVGDVLGVLLLAPPAILFLGGSDADGRERLRASLLPTVVMLLVAAIAFLAAARWELNVERARVAAQGQSFLTLLGRHMDALRDTLGGVRRALELNPDVGYEDFRQLGADILRTNPDLQAISFNPVVQQPGREAFEASMRHTYGPRFSITERGPDGELVPAAIRPDYVPVRMILPVAGNQPAVGFDVASEPQRRNALDSAKLTNSPTMTGPLRLVQLSGDETGVLVVEPVHAADDPTRIRGFAIAVLHTRALVERLRTDFPVEELSIRIYDAAVPHRPLFADATAQGVAELGWSSTLAVTDRDWIVSLAPTALGLQRIRPWGSWAAGAFGILLVAMLQVIWLGAASRTRMIRRRVEEQTAEILATRGALECSEARYRTLFEGARAPMMLIDAADGGRIVDVNQAACAFYGHSSDAMRQLRIGDIEVRDDRNLARAIGQLHRMPGERFWMCHRLANGELRDVEITTGPLSINTRTLQLSIITDITARKRLEEATRRQVAGLTVLNSLDELGGRTLAERLELALGAAAVWLRMPLGILRQVRRDGDERDVVRFSRGGDGPAGAGLNTDALAVALEGVRDGLALRDAASDPDAHAEIRACGVRAFICAPVWVAGKRCGLLAFASERVHPRAFDGHDREFVHFLARWCGHQIERERARKELTQQGELLRGALDALDEAFAIFDQDDRLVFFNDKLHVVYPRMRPVLCLGARFEDIVRYGAEHGQFRDAVGRVDAWVDERMAAHRKDSSVLLQPLDGGRWVQIREQHSAGGFSVGFRIDVTELIRAQHDSESANLAKSRFLATMSHEIRTPMNGILGMAEMLMDSDLSDDERREFAGMIGSSGRTLMGLLNDVLDLSKVEAGRMQILSELFLPAQLVDEVAALFRGLAERKGLSLEPVWEGGDLCELYGDSGRIRQMLGNLVSNAIKFTDHGSVRLAGRLEPARGDGVRLRFEVTDTGAGVAEEQRHLLFQPFSQLDDSNTRRHGGSGLGLSIVARLAELLGGRAGFEPADAGGSTFWFVVRVDAAEAVQGDEPHENPLPPTVAPEIPASAPAAFERPLVLVVEDHDINAKFTATVLRGRGYEVEIARDGQAAVDCVPLLLPALILMDCHMPVMDGYEATRQIRRMEAESGGRRVPIIALTAAAFAEDRARCMAAGMDDHLAKPVERERLIAVVQRWIAAAES